MKTQGEKRPVLKASSQKTATPLTCGSADRVVRVWMRKDCLIRMKHPEVGSHSWSLALSHWEEGDVRWILCAVDSSPALSGKPRHPLLLLNVSSSHQSLSGKLKIAALRKVLRGKQHGGRGWPSCQPGICVCACGRLGNVYTAG